MMQREDANVLVVDALNLCFRWKHRNIFDFADSYIETIRSLARSYKCGKIIVTADWGSSSYRKELSSDYKANREALRANQTEQEKEDFAMFFAEYERAVELCHAWQDIEVLKFHRVEADDIAAYLVKHKADLGIDKIWLVSSDRDWDLLINEDVSRFSYVTRKETTLATWHEQYDFDPEQYITYKCLTGDKGDNVPGIAGIGPKRAVTVMEQFGDVFDIYENCPIPGKYKYIEQLNANAEQLLLNVELMDLLTYCDEAIGYANTLEIQDKVKEFMDGKE